MKRDIFLSNRFRATSRSVIEIIGLPGVGKSTVSRLLVEKYGFSYFQSTLKAVGLTWLIINCCISIFYFLISVTSFKATEAKHYVLWHRRKFGVFKELRTWFYLLNTAQLPRSDKKAHEGYIYDQGPLFAIAWLKVFGVGGQSSFIVRLLANILVDRLTVMDCLVVLEADVDILMERIKSRGTMHDLLAIDGSEAGRFLDDYRKEFGYLIETAKDLGVQVLIIDTSNSTQASIADEVGSWVLERRVCEK